MGISLAPDEKAPPVDPLKPKPAAGLGLSPAPGAPNLTAAGTPATAPLPTEYPSAPSTTGQPQNRLQLAQTAFDTFAKSTAPQYTADLREATQKGAGAGNLGSGMLRTTYGNLANQRALALDTERSNLINTATTATIGDQQAAAGLGIQQQNADTAKTAALGNLDVAQGTLGLEKEKAATSAGQTQQQIDLAKKTADINAAYQAGTLSLAQKNQALAELQNTQQYGLEGEKLALAKTGQETSLAQTQQQLDLAKKTADIDAAYKAGTLTLAQKSQALAELAQSQQNAIQTGQLGLAEKSLDASTANQQGQLQLAKDQLAQTGANFQLSLAQQKDLATLADKTANRQIDVSSAQGQNALLLELARIMGTSTNNIDPSFLKSIAAALGIATPGAVDATGGGGSTGGGSGVVTGGGDTGGGGGKKVPAV